MENCSYWKDKIISFLFLSRLCGVPMAHTAVSETTLPQILLIIIAASYEKYLIHISLNCRLRKHRFLLKHLLLPTCDCCVKGGAQLTRPFFLLKFTRLFLKVWGWMTWLELDDKSEGVSIVKISCQQSTDKWKAAVRLRQKKTEKKTTTNNKKNTLPSHPHCLI